LRESFVTEICASEFVVLMPDRVAFRIVQNPIACAVCDSYCYPLVADFPPALIVNVFVNRVCCAPSRVEQFDTDILTVRD